LRGNSFETVQQYTDTQLVDNIRQGDIKSFELLFNQYAQHLVRYATTIVKDTDEAEDIVQQLFVGVWAKKEVLEVNTSIKSYLYKSVYNSSLNKIKQQTVKESYAEYFNYVSDGTTAGAAVEIERKETDSAIQQAIEELPEQCRIIFKMSRFEQLKYQQIADQMGLSVKTVENQMGKALKHMRVRLKDYITILIIYFLIK
jgi:RNA polymerase sigma-70 factor (family 1)